MDLFEDMLRRDRAAPRNYTRRIGDWSVSLPHLALLARFLTPNRLPAASAAQQEQLGEPLADALGRFLSQGLLLPAPVAEKMRMAFTATELRQLLKERKLPCGGNKEALAQRLCAADPRAMGTLSADLEIYVCSAAVEAHLRAFQAQASA